MADPRRARHFQEDDVNSAALVAVLGQTVARQLFGNDESPIGAVIQVKSMPLRVIGVFAPKGQTAYGTDQDDLVMIPFTTAERKVLGVAAPSQQQAPLNWVYPPPPNPYNLQQRLTGYVNQIYVQATDASQVQTAVGQVTDILIRRHRIRPGDINDFTVRNLSQIAETAESSSRIMALLLAAVASISLIVGGIGIMNILLVSVTERTREIGLRMAIGARTDACSSAVSCRVRDFERHRRHRRNYRGRRVFRNDLARCRLAGADLARRRRRRVSVFRRGRHLLRLLSGAKGRQPRSDRGAAIRMKVVYVIYNSKT